MTKLASVTAFFFLLCLSCFVSHCLSRPISLKSASDTAGKFGEEYWFDHPWLKAHPPLSAYAWPKQPWPYYAHSPMPNGGYKWGPWPGKEWPFAQSPKPDGWKWWPKQGYENHEEVAADEIEEAAVAAPPFAA